MGKHAEHSMHVSFQKPSRQCDYSYCTHSTQRLQVRKPKFTVQFIYFSLPVSVAIEQNPKKTCMPTGTQTASGVHIFSNTVRRGVLMLRKFYLYIVFHMNSGGYFVLVKIFNVNQLTF